MKFNDYRIDSKIKSQLEYMGFKKPTDIQYRCIPHILNGEDVMAVAPTGTGKTAAFVIPIINQLLKSKRKGSGIRALILVPTCLLYTSPSPRDMRRSRMPSSA